MKLTPLFEFMELGARGIGPSQIEGEEQFFPPDLYEE
jgi:hypothetical protein